MKLRIKQTDIHLCISDILKKYLPKGYEKAYIKTHLLYANYFIIITPTRPKYK